MIQIRVWGSTALFTVPHFRSDPYSYPVPTPSAAKGLLRGIYWKPEFEWEIEAIEVLNPIRYDTYKVKSIKSVNAVVNREENPPLQTLTVLVDVQYVIHARIVLNPLRARRGLHTYVAEARRRMEMGQEYAQIHFGRREFTAYYELLQDRDAAPPPIPLTRNLGRMLFDLVPIDLGIAGHAEHPDRLEPVFFRAQLDKGVLRVPRDLYDTHRDRVFAVRNRAHHPASENDHVAA